MQNKGNRSENQHGLIDLSISLHYYLTDWWFFPILLFFTGYKEAFDVFYHWKRVSELKALSRETTVIRAICYQTQLNNSHLRCLVPHYGQSLSLILTYQLFQHSCQWIVTQVPLRSVKTNKHVLEDFLDFAVRINTFFHFAVFFLFDVNWLFYLSFIFHIVMFLFFAMRYYHFHQEIFLLQCEAFCERKKIPFLTS